MRPPGSGRPREPRGVDLSNVTLRMIALIHGDLGVADETPGKDGATGVQNGVLYIAQRAAKMKIQGGNSP